MLAIVVPTIVATLAARLVVSIFQHPGRDICRTWDYSGQLELIVWAIPLLTIMLLGGVAWIGSHDLDPAKPIGVEGRSRSRSRSCRSIGSGCSSTPTSTSPASTAL